MQNVSLCLAFAGRNGPAILFFGVLIGLVLPDLAASAAPLMGTAVFVFTLGAFMKVDRKAFQEEVSRPAVVVPALLWCSVGVPAVAVAVAATGVLPAPIAAGLVLCMLAPPVGSAAAMAAMLGLRPALAMLMMVCVTLACPFYVPQAAVWFGVVGLQIEAVTLLMRLMTIVGGAFICALLLRRFAGDAVRRNPHAMTGIAVVGLLVVGVGAMHGMQVRFLQEPRHVFEVLAIAFAANAVFQLLGAAVFARCTRIDALTIGFLSGNRNVTLIWAAAAPALALQPEIELYVAMSVFPIFMLPLLMRRLLKQRNAAPRFHVAGERREP